LRHQYFSIEFRGVNHLGFGDYPDDLCHAHFCNWRAQANLPAVVPRMTLRTSSAIRLNTRGGADLPRKRQRGQCY
jgi:hypothetical protein